MGWFFDYLVKGLQKAGNDAMRCFGVIETSHTTDENQQKSGKQQPKDSADGGQQSDGGTNGGQQPEGGTDGGKTSVTSESNDKKARIKKIEERLRQLDDIPIKNFIGSEDKEWLGVFDDSIGIYNTVNGINQRRMFYRDRNKKMLSTEHIHNGRVTPWKQFIAGGIAGVLSRSSTAPIDRLKVMLQVHSNSTQSKDSVYNVLQNMVKEGGFRSLWRGNTINCIKVGPESALKFFSFENIKYFLKSNNGQEELALRERFVAGAGSGMFANGCIYPMETLKTKLAIGRTGQYCGLYDCARKVIKQDGFRGLYKGMTPGLLGMIPYAGIDLCMFETMKLNWLRSYGGEVDKLDISTILFCAAVSGICSQVASYPLGLVRTKLQAQSNDVSYTGLRAKNMFEMMRLIVVRNGILGLYRGLLPSCMKVVPAFMVNYMVYEGLKTSMGVDE